MTRTERSTAASLLLAVATVAAASGSDLRSEVDRLIEEGDARSAVALVEARSPEAARGADEWFLLARAYHAWLDDAGLLRKRGLAKHLKQSLDRALAIDPQHVDARRELIDFHHYAPWIVGGSETEAERQLAILEGIDPGAAWAVRGTHARDAGDTEAARDHYRRAVDAGPREPARLVMLAALEQRLDGYDASIALLEEVLAADPGNENAQYYRARASAMTGKDLERGRDCARRYLDSCTVCDDSDRALGYWRMAAILERQGRTDDAAAAYRQALRLDPDLEGARQGLEELER